MNEKQKRKIPTSEPQAEKILVLFRSHNYVAFMVCFSNWWSLQRGRPILEACYWCRGIHLPPTCVLMARVTFSMTANFRKHVYYAYGPYNIYIFPSCEAHWKWETKLELVPKTDTSMCVPFSVLWNDNQIFTYQQQWPFGWYPWPLTKRANPHIGQHASCKSFKQQFSVWFNLGLRWRGCVTQSIIHYCDSPYCLPRNLP